jgi:hypothetical protein
VGVYALGTIAGPHPILSLGEGKETRKQGQYACGKCLFSFWYVKFCKVGGDAAGDAAAIAQEALKTAVSARREAHGLITADANRLGGFPTPGMSTLKKVVSDARKSLFCNSRDAQTRLSFCGSFH